jgi:hypothetical protein
VSIASYLKVGMVAAPVSDGLVPPGPPSGPYSFL